MDKDGRRRDKKYERKIQNNNNNLSNNNALMCSASQTKITLSIMPITVWQHGLRQAVDRQLHRRERRRLQHQHNPASSRSGSRKSRLRQDVA